jgi:hypothetical protein
MHLRSACRVAAAQSAHDSFARVIGQRQGLLSQMGMDDGLGIIGVPPDYGGRVLDLGPRSNGRGLLSQSHSVVCRV